MKNTNTNIARRAFAPSPSKSLSTKPYHSSNQRRLVQRKKSTYFNRDLQQHHLQEEHKADKLTIITTQEVTNARECSNKKKQKSGCRNKMNMEEYESDMDEIRTPVDLLYLSQLRDEAYRDLELDYTTYNHELVYRMRSEENNGSSSSSSSSNSSVASFSAASHSKSIHNDQQDDIDDNSIDGLIDIFVSTSSIKDYSQLLKWEATQNPPTYFENEEDYGNLF
ncbi:hypothetical protein BDF20DRAFT_992064 [Mycotypha africana]|uniref:uncharacterized protein n=1 Tax=Mycotypha africana TaxID=64632 RepID=UPI0023014EDB|nr:uncharacterized protein BDF20DRAFT_992064 [Mycotypha africana]KAI8967240.1 hypothetical protein BDF20DRAFT_992064 [Mycotypha africana]